MQRIIKAFLFAPLIIIPILFVTMISLSFFDPKMTIYGTLLVAIMTSVIAVPVAYAGIVILGIPCYFFLKKLDKLTLFNIVVLGTVIGGLIGFMFLAETDTSISSIINHIYFGFCGTSVAYTAWYLGLR